VNDTRPAAPIEQSEPFQGSTTELPFAFDWRGRPLGDLRPAVVPPLAMAEPAAECVPTTLHAGVSWRSVRHRTLLVVAGVSLTLAAAGLIWWHSRYQPINVDRADVVSVRIQPVPEGPPGPAFVVTASGSTSRPLSMVAAAIPVPLPGPGVQPFGCGAGGDLIVTLNDGHVITYGPCRRPASIDRLWAVMLNAATGGRCLPRCGP
jgi:hypothetical protein